MINISIPIYFNTVYKVWMNKCKINHFFSYITTWCKSVARAMTKAYGEGGNFTLPPATPKPFDQLWKNWHRWLYQGCLPPCHNSSWSDKGHPQTPICCWVWQTLTKVTLLSGVVVVVVCSCILMYYHGCYMLSYICYIVGELWFSCCYVV